LQLISVISMLGIVVDCSDMNDICSVLFVKNQVIVCIVEINSIISYFGLKGSFN